MYSILLDYLQHDPKPLESQWKGCHLPYRALNQAIIKSSPLGYVTTLFQAYCNVHGKPWAVTGFHVGLLHFLAMHTSSQ